VDALRLPPLRGVGGLGVVCFIAGLSKKDCLLFLLTGAGLVFGALLLYDPFFGMN